MAKYFRLLCLFPPVCSEAGGSTVRGLAARCFSCTSGTFSSASEPARQQFEEILGECSVVSPGMSSRGLEESFFGNCCLCLVKTCVLDQIGSGGFIRFIVALLTTCMPFLMGVEESLSVEKTVLLVLRVKHLKISGNI